MTLQKTELDFGQRVIVFVVVFVVELNRSIVQSRKQWSPFFLLKFMLLCLGRAVQDGSFKFVSKLVVAFLYATC